jgi:hypothetical protein
MSWWDRLYEEKKLKVNAKSISELTDSELADRIEAHVWDVGGPYTDFGVPGIWFVYLEAAARLKNPKVRQLLEEQPEVKQFKLNGESS